MEEEKKWRGEDVVSRSEAEEIAAEEDWGRPSPLTDSGEEEQPEFPLGNYPETLSRYLALVSVATQTAPEMAGILGLGVLATLFQRNYTLRLSNHWREPLCLYTVAVAAPAERKSAVLGLLTGPIRGYESARYHEDLMRAEQEAAMHDILCQRVETLKRDAARNRQDMAGSTELEDALSELAYLKEVHPCRILADDATPERLAALMEEQGGCITLCSAEGGVFDAMNGRYDQRANLDVYLKGHAGDTIYVDRVGRRANRIEDPRLSMLLAVQPQVLSGLMGSQLMRGRGLAARFLYAVCTSMVGRRTLIETDIPQEVMDAYAEFVTDALDTPYSGELTLSPAAQRLLSRFASDVEARLAGDLHLIQDWGGKLVGAICRIAGLLHCAQHVDADPTRHPVRAETLEAAIGFSEFLAANAKRAYNTTGYDGETADALYLLGRIRDERLMCCTRRELQRMVHRTLNAARLDKALSVLASAGYVRTERSRHDSVLVRVNPYLYLD